MPSSDRWWLARQSFVLVLLLMNLLGIYPQIQAGDDVGPGAAIYQAKCASCHGMEGEGSKEYAKPLIGDKSIGQLSRLVEKTMPEDDPGSCVGEDARSVAAFLHQAFYSRTAQERNRPARVELSRLTVRQYRNTLSDLVGSFQPRVGWDGGSGLKGRYYRSRQIGRDKDLVFEQLDPEIRFDFGVEAPRPEGFDRAQFSIVWKGSIFVPDTGEHEFIVRSDQAIRFFLNDAEHPLMDASVASVEHSEQRASIFLLGGRAYPINLEFSKAKQGVDDSKDPKKKIPEKRSFIHLAWKLAGQAEQLIPARFLSPTATSASMVPTTPFPPDDRSVGYERGSTISRAWDTAITEAAIESCVHVSDHLRTLSGVSEDDADRNVKLEKFCATFAERAFRRPLDSEQQKDYVSRPFREAKNVESAVRRSILSVLKSPRFLYRELSCVDAYEVAARLSYGLWDAPPDEVLYQAAQQNQLSTHEQIVSQAERMLGDIRAKTKIRQFFLQWLRVDQIPDIAKDSSLYPEFDTTLIADLRTSLELSLDDFLASPTPDFRHLLLSDQTYLNGRLARFFDQALPEDAAFQKIKWNQPDRSGVLTHPYLLANFAYTATTSPIHRGVFLMRSVLGRTLRPPPEAIAPLAPELHAGLSTRQRVELQTSPTACVNCHAQINPLGFGLENFDAVGRLRQQDNAQPVDASGIYESLEGETQPFRGARELGSILAASSETHAAFVTQLFHQLVKQPIQAFGMKTRPNLTQYFQTHDYDVRRLIIEIVALSASPVPVSVQ